MSKDYTDICEKAPTSNKEIDETVLEDAVESLEISFKTYLMCIYGEDEEFNTKSTLELRILRVAEMINGIT